MDDPNEVWPPRPTIAEPVVTRKKIQTGRVAEILSIPSLIFAILDWLFIGRLDEIIPATFQKVAGLLILSLPCVALYLGIADRTSLSGKTGIGFSLFTLVLIIFMPHIL